MSSISRAARRLALALALVAVAHLPAYGADTHAIIVFAAASLTDAFKAIGKTFEQGHPASAVQFNFAASSTLVQQIREGAPADVFAAADETSMKKAVDAGDVAGAPRVFASNRLIIAVPAGNPGHIGSLADLGKSGLTLALAAPQVPAGKYASEAFAKAGLAVPAASQEVDVRAVLNKVALHEADAGIVYVTDLRGAAGKVEGIAIPDQFNVSATYPIAVLASATNAGQAAAFLDYVVSPTGQATLREFGFLAP